jgi:hypothetical protein
MPEQHSAFGYSAVSTFEQCRFRYKLQFVDHLKAIPSDDPCDALIIGTALHKAIETDIDTAIEEYFNSYNIIDDLHINEEIKLRHLITKVKEILPEGIHEVQVVDRNFMGTLDMLVPVDQETIEWGKMPFDYVDEVYDLYDFKYSNHWIRYMESRQLHLYKYYFEKMNPGKRIRNMYFLFVPKVLIRPKKTETIFDFRQRLNKELDKVEPRLEVVQYDPTKVIEHLEITQIIAQTNEFSKNPTNLCGWCQYKNYCETGDVNDMTLPSTNRVAVDATKHKKIWIYGQPMTGKTLLCDFAPTPLNLNTDGNVKNVTMARLPIKDTMDGRQKKLAWEVFKGAIDDLEAGSDFETIIVDLLEDCYESCRLFMYKQMGITHESDDAFRAWDKVRTEFLSTFRRLLNLPYNIVLISHEDMSKDITKRSGDKITAIKPNIQDKIANKIAGMVDVILRTTKDGDEYLISTKSSDVVFGGGRLPNMKAVERETSWETIESLYGDMDSQNAAKTEEVPAADKEPTETETVENTASEDVTETVEEPKRRTRRTRN